jgi:hypothetical protein
MDQARKTIPPIPIVHSDRDRKANLEIFLDEVRRRAHEKMDMNDEMDEPIHTVLAVLGEMVRDFKGWRQPA